VVDLGGPKPLRIVSAAYAINDVGQVTGEYDGTASLWSASNVRTSLGTLGGPTSTGRAINSRGAVVGWSATAEGRTHAFLKTIDSPIRDLRTLGGSMSMALGINEDGRVIGSSTLASGDVHAFLWTAGGGMEDLGTLPGGRSSAATGINTAGAIIGWSTVAGGATHAFLWTRAAGMEDITPKTGITNPGGLSDNYRTYEGIKIYTLVF
jgi:probable HAF family extracellular repeat protein